MRFLPKSYLTTLFMPEKNIVTAKIANGTINFNEKRFFLFFTHLIIMHANKNAPATIRVVKISGLKKYTISSS